MDGIKLLSMMVLKLVHSCIVGSGQGTRSINWWLLPGYEENARKDRKTKKTRDNKLTKELTQQSTIKQFTDEIILKITSRQARTAYK